jgi:deoxyinosine 3'endonuclease (endonuclease V)
MLKEIERRETMKPIAERTTPVSENFQRIYRFDNGYGASVIKGRNSYGGKDGLWELAVIKFKSENPLEYTLVYDTPITDDVIGYLKWKEVKPILKSISELKGDVS